MGFAFCPKWSRVTKLLEGPKEQEMEDNGGRGGGGGEEIGGRPRSRSQPGLSFLCLLEEGAGGLWVWGVPGDPNRARSLKLWGEKEKARPVPSVATRGPDEACRLCLEPCQGPPKKPAELASAVLWRRTRPSGLSGRERRGAPGGSGVVKGQGHPGGGAPEMGFHF